MAGLTEHQKAKILAAEKDMSLEKLIRKALDKGLFVNLATTEPYSLSWVKSRLKSDDQRIVPKLGEV